MACRSNYTPNLKERVLEALCVNQRMSRLFGTSVGMTVNQIAEYIYTDQDGGPEWSLSCVRVAVFKLRKLGVVVSNKIDRAHFGKTGRMTMAVYNIS